MSGEIVRAESGALTPAAEAEIAALARRAATARGPLMKAIGLAGSQAENMLEKLPDSAKDAIEKATERALELAYRGAEVAVLHRLAERDGFRGDLAGRARPAGDGVVHGLPHPGGRAGGVAADLRRGLASPA